MATSINYERWQTCGSFETLEGHLRIIWVDKFCSHPLQGVYLASVGTPADIRGNPSDLREAPFAVYRQLGRI